MYLSFIMSIGVGVPLSIACIYYHENGKKSIREFRRYTSKSYFGEKADYSAFSFFFASAFSFFFASAFAFFSAAFSRSALASAFSAHLAT